MKISNLTIFTFCLLFISSSCKKDPIVPNEEEVITTLTYTLISASGEIAVFSFKDLDGDGGNAPVISTDTLMANTNYSGQITLFNETESPAINITDEVIGEAESHQLFYTLSISTTAINYADTDANGKPLGIQTDLTTGSAAQGTLTIVLRHQPDKDASGVANGVIDNAGGETDIEISFSVNVQ